VAIVQTVRRITPLIVLFLTGVAGAAVGVGTYAGLGGHTTTTTVVREASGTTGKPTSNTSDGLSVNEIYRRTAPGVVEVTSRQTSASQFPFGRSQESVGQGSGFVYDSSGHVVTNEHVVDGASSVTVKFQSGKSYSAKVVGKDSSTDVAVLKVNAPSSELHPLTLADSGNVAVGDGVVAIGSPFGLENSVTSGIVSALHRSIDSPNGFSIPDAIQTDAAINHGNSGGPLLDASGNVIGITSQIESDSGGNDGVGFAVPSNTVRSVASQLLATGKVQHAYLGVQITSAAAGGARVASVRPGTPAAKAGIQAGDVITKVNGTSIGSSNELQQAIDALKPGDKITLEIRRGGTTKTVHATLGARPS
jgi:putative serine protease PepD